MGCALLSNHSNERQCGQHYFAAKRTFLFRVDTPFAGERLNCVDPQSVTVWQYEHSCVVGIWLMPLPVAIVPLWHAEHTPLIIWL